MGYKHLSHSIRAFSGYGLSAMALYAIAGQSAMAIPMLSISFTTNDSDLSQSKSSDGSGYLICTAQEISNSCKPNPPMRALTKEEIELVIGANSTTYGGCNDMSCHVTADIPPDFWSPPPANSPGNGGGIVTFPSRPPPTDDQAYWINCAKILGNTEPAPGFATNFTSDYGWSSYSTAGVSLAHTVTPTFDEPSTSQIPPGGGPWLLIAASTYYEEPPIQN